MRNFRMAYKGSLYRAVALYNAYESRHNACTKMSAQGKDRVFCVIFAEAVLPSVQT